jgi:hypothetical protein
MTPPVLGAAMMTPEIRDHRDWLFERDRDLELQDFILPQILDDWRACTARSST